MVILTLYLLLDSLYKNNNTFIPNLDLGRGQLARREREYKHEGGGSVCVCESEITYGSRINLDLDQVLNLRVWGKTNSTSSCGTEQIMSVF